MQSQTEEHLSTLTTLETKKRTPRSFTLARAPVFQAYGRYYDIIYSDKDYEKECDFLERIFQKYLKRKPKTILDVGCGTGGHSVILAKRGYQVTGIDPSEVMIDLAREKAGKNSVDVDFRIMDVRNLRLDQQFDCCVGMFAVMDYLTSNQHLQKAIVNVRRHLKRGGLFIFDFWYGPAVLSIGPSERVKTVEKQGVRVIRHVVPRLDIFRHTCEVNYHLIVTKNKSIVDEIREKHMVRFFFPQEIRHYLEENAFKLVKMCPFLNLNAKPNEKDWNVAAISKATPAAAIPKVFQQP
jgi:SAM-dependent methyltransferase